MPTDKFPPPKGDICNVNLSVSIPSRQSSQSGQLGWRFVGQFFAPDEPTGDGMSRITVMGAVLVLLAAVVAADAQGIGYGPGVNPSNPSDLTHRSNPQDLTAPGGSNRQDLVRRPAGVTSVVTSPTRTTTRRYKNNTKSAVKSRSGATTSNGRAIRPYGRDPHPYGRDYNPYALGVNWPKAP